MHVLSYLLYVLLHSLERGAVGPVVARSTTDRDPWFESYPGLT